MKTKFTLIITAAILILTACSRKVTRIDPVDTPDISGSWNQTDSRLTAEQMISQSLGEAWLNNYVQEKGKKPTVIVGMITNKSHEHIEAETFMKDLERTYINTTKVGLVQSGTKREEMRGEKADQQSNSSVSTMKKFGLESFG